MAEDLISNQILKPSTEEAEAGRSELQDSQGYIEKPKKKKKKIASWARLVVHKFNPSTHREAEAKGFL